MSRRLYNIFKLLACAIFCLLLIDKLSAQDKSQDSSDEYYTLARAAGAKGDFVKAAKYAEKGLKESPLDMDIKEYLGKCYMEIGQLDRARITLLEVLRSSPRRVDARHYLINIETQQKRYYSAVCYANELLEITPYWKGLWLKKIELYNLMGNWAEANRAANRLFTIYPNDKDVRALYNNMLKEQAAKESKAGNFDQTIAQYEKVLDLSPKDQEAYLSLINAYTKAGNFSMALTVADRGLQALPNNNAITDKKIGLLDETNDYQRAIKVTEDRLKIDNSPHYKTILGYLTEEAARYYNNADPYVLYGKIYEKNKGNKEAFNFLLNTSIVRGYYPQAEELVSNGLKSEPNSKQLLSKQLFIYEAQKNWEKGGLVAEKLYALYPNDADVKEKYEIWVYEKAKIDFKDQNYKEALWGFLKVSESPMFSKFANEHIFTIYTNQKSYNEALKVINGLIAKNPNESQYVLKKIDLLMQSEDYEQAYTLAKASIQKSPKSPEYKYIAGESGVAYIKYLNLNEDFPKVKLVSDELLTLDTANILAYQYGIGARASMKQYDDAISFIKNNNADIVQNKDIQLKLAGVYSEAGQHVESVGVLKALRDKYPYNDSLKNNLIEELLVYGKSLDDSTKFNQSKAIYAEIQQIEPKNAIAAIKYSNILLEQNQLDSAMTVVDYSLAYNKDNSDLLYQKGLVYEKLGDYKQAKDFQAKFMGTLNKEMQHQERLDDLDSKGMKNQVSLSYLKASSDSVLVNTSIATVEYMRKINKNNDLVARVNYAARKAGVGLQGELDWYHRFKNKINFMANVGVANQFFPDFKASMSLYVPFAKTWQVELGGRYSTIPNDIGFFTGIVGLEKTFNKVWLNARGLIMTDTYDVYHGIVLQSRFYMRNDANYIVAMAGAGTAPEDERLLWQVNTFTSYVSSMVGAGYYHQVNPRTSIGLQGNWYNFKMTPDRFINQYNLFLTVKTRF